MELLTPAFPDSPMVVEHPEQHRELPFVRDVFIDPRSHGTDSATTYSVADLQELLSQPDRVQVVRTAQDQRLKDFTEIEDPTPVLQDIQTQTDTGGGGE